MTEGAEMKTLVCQNTSRLAKRGGTVYGCGMTIRLQLGDKGVPMSDLRVFLCDVQASDRDFDVRPPGDPDGICPPIRD